VVRHIINTESKPILGPAKRLIKINIKTEQIILTNPIEKNIASFIVIKDIK
jgi:hypothetical protein